MGLIVRPPGGGKAVAVAAAFGPSLGAFGKTWFNESHSDNTPAGHCRQSRPVRTPRRAAVGRPYRLFRM